MALILILQKFPKTRKEVSFKMSQDSKWLSPFYSKYFAHTSFVQSSFFSINSRPRQKCNTQNKWTEKFPDWVVKGRTVLRRTQMLTRMNFDVLEEREREIETKLKLTESESIFGPLNTTSAVSNLARNNNSTTLSDLNILWLDLKILLLGILSLTKTTWKRKKRTQRISLRQIRNRV